MKFDETIKIGRLIDLYGKLLTDKQFNMLQNYYFDNLSLSEIAENEKVSRQAVNDTIKKSTKLLETFESKLNLLTKEIACNKIISSTMQVEDKLNRLIQEIRK